jgi:MFS family permease
VKPRMASVAADYPYLQGLWAIPMGIGTIVAGASNLHWRPEWPWIWILAIGVSLNAVVFLLIARYYRANYGKVKPTRAKELRYAAAVVAWVVVLFIGANRLLLWSIDSPFCVYASAFALATLVFYAIIVGLKAHHIVIWGSLLVAGLLPIWGGLGVNRDAAAMLLLGLAFIASGLLDQRLLARSFSSPGSRTPEDSDVGH